MAEKMTMLEYLRRLNYTAPIPASLLTAGELADMLEDRAVVVDLVNAAEFLDMQRAAENERALERDRQSEIHFSRYGY